MPPPESSAHQRPPLDPRTQEQQLRRKLQTPRNLMKQMSFRALMSPSPSGSRRSGGNHQKTASDVTNDRSIGMAGSGDQGGGMGTLFGDAWIARPLATRQETELVPKDALIYPISSRGSTLYDVSLGDNPMEKMEKVRRASVDWEYHRPDTRNGWFVVACAAIACLVAMSTLLTYSVYLEYYMAANMRTATWKGGPTLPGDGTELVDVHLGTNALQPTGSQATWHSILLGVLIGALMSASTAGFSLAAGLAADTVGYRMTAMTGALLTAIGLFSSSFATRLQGLCVTQGVVAGTGVAFLLVPAYSVAPLWFDKHRALASGVAAGGGGGLGVVIVAPVLNALLRSNGMATALQVQALVVLVLGGGAALGLRKRIEANRWSSVPVQWRARLGDARVWALAVMAILAASSRFAQLLCLPAFARANGLDGGDAVAVVYVLGASLAVGAVGAGAYADRSGYVAGLGLSELLMGAFTLVLWTPATSVVPMYIYAVLFGLCSGALAAVLPPAIAQMFGVPRLASSVGLVVCVAVPAILASVPAAARFQDLAVHRYSTAWVTAISGVLSLAAGLVAQFLEWYGHEEDRLAEGQDQEAHAYAELLRQRATQCSTMLQTIGDIETQLARMESGYREACEQTQGVRQACVDLGGRRDRLTHTAKEVHERLAVYNALGPISQLLNSPGDRVCLDQEFLPSLERTESAIAFIETRAAGARDSELFLMRFAQCRMRALSLIKIHALRVFKQLAAELGTAFASGHGRAAALYVRFRASATQLAPLLRALHERAAGSGSTERQVLLDVHNAYVHARRAWLRPYIDHRLAEIASEHQHQTEGDARVAALRDWCAFMMNVCADEYRIYYDFFSASADTIERDSAFASSPALRAYLDSLMTMFHEHVRPIVIHEPDVSVLAGLSLTLLTYHHAPPQPHSSRSEEPDDDDGSRKSISYAPVDSELDAFYAVIDLILRDTQQRLVYRAQTFIGANIASYRVSKEDGAAVVRWVKLCVRLRISDPEQLVALVAQAEVTVEMQQPSNKKEGSGRAPSSSASASSFVDVSTAALGSTDHHVLGDAGGTVAGLLQRMPDGSMEADDIDALRWIYPPVQSYRWLVGQIDGCIDYDVQQSLLDEALAACKLNLLNQGARFVRDASASIGSDTSPTVQTARGDDGIHADQLAHLFVTYNLNSIEHAFF
ncbi:Golgi transport complex subunit 3 [Coemansia sp. RSA 1933]|nr:Golgi transport complex subunit 3 [Coemansia sp. RSA 1933]